MNRLLRVIILALSYFSLAAFTIYVPKPVLTTAPKPKYRLQVCVFFYSDTEAAPEGFRPALTNERERFLDLYKCSLVTGENGGRNNISSGLSYPGGNASPLYQYGSAFTALCELDPSKDSANSRFAPPERGAIVAKNGLTYEDMAVDALTHSTFDFVSVDQNDKAITLGNFPELDDARANGVVKPELSTHP